MIDCGRAQHTCCARIRSTLGPVFPRSRSLHRHIVGRSLGEPQVCHLNGVYESTRRSYLPNQGARVRMRPIQLVVARLRTFSFEKMSNKLPLLRVALKAVHNGRVRRVAL